MLIKKRIIGLMVCFSMMVNLSFAESIREKLLNRLGLVQAQIKENNFKKESLINYKQFTEKYDKDINDEVLFKIGNIYKELKRFEDATSAYKKLIKDFPSSSFNKEAQLNLKNSLIALINHYYEEQKYLGVVGIFRADKDLLADNSNLEKIVNLSYRNLGLNDEKTNIPENKEVVLTPVNKTILKGLTIVVNAPPQILTSKLIPATVGVKYFSKLEAKGGTGTVTWKIGEGKLPDGLILDTKEGVISGIPLASGSTKFYLSVVDLNMAAANQSLDMVINPPPLITTVSLPVATTGINYKVNLSVSGGTAPYVWSIIEGGLPEGLRLDEVSGIIFGVPTGEGIRNFVIKVEDANMAIALK